MPRRRLVAPRPSRAPIGNRERALLLASLLVPVACGAPDDRAPMTEDEIVDAPPLVEPASPPQPGASEEPSASDVGVPNDEGPRADEVDDDDPGSGRCRAPAHVSSAPRTLEQTIALLNALPRPTTLACFLESLARPLRVYFTKSQLSAQPAGGDTSPRTFIVNGRLVLSIVPDGPASDLLEVGYRTSDDRAIRAELPFPVTRRITAESLSDHIAISDRYTICAACHGRETRVSDPFLGELAFESNIIPPNPSYRVALETMQAEHAACDAEREPARCANLRALFEPGEVVDSSVWDGAR